MRKIIIGIMGPGNNALASDLENAYQLGKLIAQEGWVLLTGGRNTGVMDAASKGAKSIDGLTIGILPTKDKNSISEGVDIAIITDIGNGRNNINILSSDVVIACGMGAGTASEIALAIKENKNVILLNPTLESRVFFHSIGKNNIYIAETPEIAIEVVKTILGDRS